MLPLSQVNKQYYVTLMSLVVMSEHVAEYNKYFFAIYLLFSSWLFMFVHVKAENLESSKHVYLLYDITFII